MRKFESGTICLTDLVSDRMYKDELFNDFLHNAINCHLFGDWGDLCEEDKALNEEAVRLGNGRIMSVYKQNGDTLWIITEADRSYTTILFPDEYPKIRGNKSI